MLAPGSNDPAPAFAMSDKSGKHVRIYACAQREALLNQLHVSASTKLGIKLTGVACATCMMGILVTGFEIAELGVYLVGVSCCLA